MRINSRYPHHLFLFVIRKNDWVNISLLLFASSDGLFENYCYYCTCFPSSLKSISSVHTQTLVIFSSTTTYTNSYLLSLRVWLLNCSVYDLFSESSLLTSIVDLVLHKYNHGVNFCTQSSSVAVNKYVNVCTVTHLNCCGKDQDTITWLALTKCFVIKKFYCRLLQHVFFIF